MKEKIPLTGAILLGGESRRLGSPKAFLTHRGKSLTALLAEKMEPHVDRVLFVGKTINQVPQDAKELGAFAADKPGFSGPLAGLAGALVHSKTPWVFLTAADMPFLKMKVVEEMWERKGEADAVVPYVSGYWQPLCALWSQKVLDRLKDSSWRSFQYLLDQGGLSVVRIEEKVLRAWCEDLSCLQGFNTPEEWQKIQKRLS